MPMLFQIANLAALAAWIALVASVFLPRWRAAVWTATGLGVPLLFAVAYGLLLALHWTSEGGFGSLAEVQALFQVPGLLLAGWLHYLAFDLFVGTWIARDAAARRVPAGALLPCLALTFLAGPLGLLLYGLVRLLGRRRDAVQGT